MNRRPISLPVLLLSFAAAAVVACSDDDTEDTTVTPGGADSGADATPDAASGAPQIADVTLSALVALTAAEPVTFTATGSTPITWSISAGSAPAGMTLDPVTGVYGGTPTANGDFQLTVTATNAAGSSSLALMQTVGSPARNAYALLANNQISAFSTLLPSGATAPVTLSTGLNLRVDPNSGTVTNDTSLNGGDTGAVETAYTNSFINATATTQYTIGNASKTLYIQNVPNGGTLTLPIAVTPAPEAFLGFDIGETVTTATSATAVTAGLGYAGVRLAGQATDSFASIDLVSGQLGVIGAFPSRAPSGSRSRTPPLVRWSA